MADLQAAVSEPSDKTVHDGNLQKSKEVGGTVGPGGILQKPKHPVHRPGEQSVCPDRWPARYGSPGGEPAASAKQPGVHWLYRNADRQRICSTLHTFAGSYIDQYTIEQAVKDSATVPIFYASRLPGLCA